MIRISIYQCWHSSFNSNNVLHFFQAIAELGVVIYSSLDFGLKEAEERQLTPGLETLLDLMTSLG